MNPQQDFSDWLKVSLLPADYVYSLGIWRDSTGSESKRFVSYLFEGGPKPDVENRTIRARVIVLGPQSGRAHALSILGDASALVDRTVAGDYRHGCITQIRAIGDIMGPGYTTEDRPWVEVNFEIIT